MAIYVKFKAPKTLRGFLAKFFSFSPFTHITRNRAFETYKDKECTKLQCVAGRSRSSIDLLELARTYYPDTTPKELMAELLMLRPGGKYFSCWYCSTVRRPVMSFDAHKMYYFPRKSKSEMGWGNLLRELGIKNLDEMYNYGK